MNRVELFIFLLNDIMQSQSITDSDIKDNIDDDNVEDAITGLLTQIKNPNLKRLLSSLKKIFSNYRASSVTTDEYHLTGQSSIMDFDATHLKAFKRSVYYADTEFKFLLMDRVFENGDLLDLSARPNIDFWELIEHYLVREYENGGNSNDFLNLIVRTSINKGILINMTTYHVDEKQMFMYCYLNSLNYSKPVPIITDLSITPRVMLPSLNYNNGFEYSQYIDIYDIINETVLSTDILSKFMKIYHVLEFLAYRSIMVEIVNNTRNKTFMLEIINQAKKIESERNTVVKKLTMLFDSEKPLINSRLVHYKTPIIKAYAEKYWQIKNLNFSDMNTFSNIIYSIRCNIVHSKDSEIHFTLSNPDEYRDIIPLMKDTIHVLEEIIMTKISLTCPQIHYPQKVIEVYK